MCSLVCLVGAASPVFGVELDSLELEAPGRLRAVLPGDFDGDGRNDLGVAYLTGQTPLTERKIGVFWQNEDGSYTFGTDSVFDIPDSVALLDSSAIGFTRDRILLLDYEGIDAVFFENRAPTPLARLVDVESVVFHGESDDVTHFELDPPLFDGNQLFVPQWGKLAVLECDGSGMWSQAQVRIPQQAYYLAGPLRHSFRISDQSLQVALTTPLYESGDVDGDGRKDLLVHRDENLFVYLRRSDGGFDEWPTAAAHFPLRSDEEKENDSARLSMVLGDIDGDGVIDVAANKLSGGMRAMQGATSVFLGIGDGSFTEKPVWSLEDSGYASSLSLVDADSEPGKELIIPNAKIGLFELSRIALSGSISLEIRTFKAGRGMDDEAESSFDFDVLLDYSGGAQLLSPDPLYEDFDGDGLDDLLLSRGDALFELYRGTKSGFDMSAPIASVSAPVSRSLRALPGASGVGSVAVIFYPFDEKRTHTLRVIRSKAKGDRLP
ncbi:MAG: hypothetical protein AUK47_20105 [Deltaproteobacteria bacterium CG2_30_63_29]|nr:MAG: hypothetical protein AUK47_20105 [Deltaproteobacteria bacterium CG2_30_63_29]PJB34046.1 MAG: hypothetical protein CO108_29470 [Deltaproteobacteria bacterium CG_4_9_14_3_um_filter_63_12]